MHQRITPLLVLLATLWATVSGAQGVSQNSYYNYNSRTGLPSNKVNGVVQDEKGFLWLATQEGLVRFDGIRYRLFRKSNDDPHNIPFSSVEHVMIDQKKRLWVYASNTQVGIFDTHTFNFKAARIRPADSSLVSELKAVLSFDDGEVFLGIAGREILRYDDASNTFLPADAFFPRPLDWQVMAFWKQKNQRNYWAILKNGIAKYNYDTKVMSYTGHNTENDPLLDILGKFTYFNALHFDQKGRIWVAAWKGYYAGLYCYDLNTGTFILENEDFLDHIQGYYEIRGFEELSDGTVWIRGVGILAYFDENTRQVVYIPPGPKPYEQVDYTVVNDIFEDRDHNIWLGTEKNGLYRFNPSSAYFTNISYTSKNADKISEGSPLTFVNEPDGSFLAGVWGEGLYRYDAQLKRVPLGIDGFSEKSTLAVWDICPDADGRHAWFACQPGIFKYDQWTHRIVAHYDLPIFGQRTIRQVEQDPQGNLWFGTQGLGVVKWNAQTGQTAFEKGLYKLDQLKINRPVNHIYIDRRGWVWIATSTSGLYVLDSKTDRLVMHFHESADGGLRLPENGAAQVLQYNDSIMLFTTSSQIFSFNTHTLTKKTIFSDEMISGFIASLVLDKNGFVWMGTTTKLYRFRPDSRIVMGLDREDGIFDDMFTLSAVGTLPDQRLIFGAENHLVVFQPDKVKSQPLGNRVTMTDLRCNNISWPLDSLLALPEITLGPDDNGLTIDLSPLVYDNWLVVQYKMEGLDKDWIFADKNFRVVYPYLPPGKYRFLVRTIDSEMQISEEQSLFSLRAYPPFYQSWWFFSLILLFAGGLLYWYDQERMKRKAAIADVRNKIADDLHSEVNVALQNINILSEMANIKAAYDPEKSREFIAQIQHKSRHMIDALEDMLWSLTPGNDSMEKMLARLHENLARLQARHEQPIALIAEDTVMRLRLDTKNRYELFLLFKETAKGMVSVCPHGFKMLLSTRKNLLCCQVLCETEEYHSIALNNLLQWSEWVKRATAVQAEWDLQKHKSGFVLEINTVFD